MAEKAPTGRTVADASDLHAFNPDLLTIQPARRRGPARIMSASRAQQERARREKFDAALSRIASGFPPPSAPVAALDDKTPAPTMGDDPATNIWNAWRFAVLATARHRAVEAQWCYGRHTLRKPDGYLAAERREAQKARDAAIELLVRTPAPSLNLHALKRDRDTGIGNIAWLRTHQPEQAKLLDDEKARLETEKAQRKAQRTTNDTHATA